MQAFPLTHHFGSVGYSSYEVSLPQVIAAFILCWIPWAAYGNGSRELEKSSAVRFLIGVVYWLAYAVPLFWLKHDISPVKIWENINYPRTR